MNSILRFFSFYLLLFILATFCSHAYAQMRDPTQPIRQVSVQPQQALSLQAIFIGGSQRAVIINGQRLYKHSRIESWTVHKIENASVVLKKNKTEKRLFLR